MNNTTSPLTLIILGLQGSGKGTQAQALVDKYGFYMVDTGALIRKAVKNGNLSSKDKKLTAEGKLISTEGSAGLIEKDIKRIGSEKKIIIDGFPRSMGQLYRLIKVLKNTHRIDVYKALFIKINKKTVLERVLTRTICSKCGKILMANQKKCQCGGVAKKRADDKPELVKNRLKFVSKNLDSIKAYFKKQGKLIIVNGEQTPAKVFSEIEKKVGLF